MSLINIILFRYSLTKAPEWYRRCLKMFIMAEMGVKMDEVDKFVDNYLQATEHGKCR